MTLDLDLGPDLPELRRLPFVGAGAADCLRLELVACASELATLAGLACAELQKLSAAEQLPGLAAECARLRAAANEVLQPETACRRWREEDFEYALELFRRHLCDATALRERVSLQARRRPLRRLWL